MIIRDEAIFIFIDLDNIIYTNQASARIAKVFMINENSIMRNFINSYMRVNS